MAALTGFNVPELRQTYFGSNPFALKRDAIENVSSWAFAMLAATALGIQVAAEIWATSLPDRAHSSSYYLIVSSIAAVAVAFVTWLLTRIVRRLARRKWLPQIITSQRELFTRAESFLANDGFYSEQLEEQRSEPGTGLDPVRSRNRAEVITYLEQIEKLVELPPLADSSEGAIAARIQRLRPYFRR